MLKLRKTTLALFSICVSGIILVASLYCEEVRNPFQSCLPHKVEQPVEEAPAEQPVIEVKEIFDESLYKINGLIWGSYKPKAIINNEIYGVGDKLSEAEITKIDKNGVTLIFNDEEYVITPEKKIDFKIEEEKQGVGNE